MFPTTWGRFNILWILPLIYSFGLFEEFSIGLSLFSSLLFLSIESAPTRVSLTNVPSNGLSSGEPFVADRALIDKDSFLYILESHRLPLLRHSHLNYNCSLYRLLLFFDGDRLARESLASYSATAGFGYHVLGLFFAYWSGGSWQWIFLLIVKIINPSSDSLTADKRFSTSRDTSLLLDFAAVLSDWNDGRRRTSALFTPKWLCHIFFERNLLHFGRDCGLRGKL